MNLEDEPLDNFYPVCCCCGETITDKGYKFNGDYYCEDCFDYEEIDGAEEAEDKRYAAYENAEETFYGRR